MLETATRIERASSDVGNRRSSFELRGHGNTERVELQAGFEPASADLEDRCLSARATGAWRPRPYPPPAALLGRAIEFGSDHRAAHHGATSLHVIPAERPGLRPAPRSGAGRAVVSGIDAPVPLQIQLVLRGVRTAIFLLVNGRMTCLAVADAPPLFCYPAISAGVTYFEWGLSAVLHGPADNMR
jgi:hypothetical protein